MQIVMISCAYVCYFRLSFVALAQKGRSQASNRCDQNEIVANICEVSNILLIIAAEP